MHGALHIDLPEERGRLAFAQLEGRVKSIGLDRPSQIDLHGEVKLPGQARESTVRLLGTVSPARDAESEFRVKINLDAVAEALDVSALFNSLLAEHLPGTSVRGDADLKLTLESQVPEGLGFRFLLESSGITITPKPDSPQPLKIEALSAAGIFSTMGEEHRIENLALQVDETFLAGHIAWKTTAGPLTARVDISSGTLPVARLKTWLPLLPTSPETLQRVRDRVGDQGSFTIASAALAYSSPGSKEETGHWQVERLQGELRQTAWQPEQGPTILVSSMPVVFAHQQLEIVNGRGQWGSSSIAYNASILLEAKTEPQFTADFHGASSLPGLYQDWQVAGDGLAASGQLDVKGHLQGSLSKFSMDLTADLADVALEHASHFALKPQPGDSLALHGTSSSKGFVLEHGTLQWAGLRGQLSGAYAWGTPASLSLDGIVSVDNLAELAEAFPAAHPLELTGQVSLNLKQRGWPDGTWPETTLALRDAGLTPTRHIARLNRINGKVRLTAAGMEAQNLRVHLGQSPLTVQARLENYAQPFLTLDVTGPSVRADELIFPSGKATLRDIVGHLEINREGLRFAPVKVLLDGGTQATVHGEIAFKSPGDVRLDITSKFVRISEIIGLWADGPEISSKADSEVATKAEKPEAYVQINARAASGDLYGMRFQNATGVIIPGRERLSIHPLDFSVGEGYCNAQVLVDYVPQGPNLLRISGHADGVDALEVYQELLNQKNIVRGRLRGDYYLQGETGANFLPSSTGDFSIEIHKGVLHQFPVLSKIFSLLNVSQLFALELPDMDKEGMPFSKLTGNLRLDKGVLSSDDLVIRSEAMNLAYRGTLNLVNREIDLAIAIHPLGTVDKIVSRIPVAGWLLTGEDEAVLSAHFTATGNASDADIMVQPLDTLSETTLGLLRRTLGLPFKLLDDPQILWGGSGKKE